MNKLKRDKWIRIMSDYCADGVWQKDGAGTSADELPVPKPLIARLRAWQELYTSEEVDEPAFSIEGLLIAQEVKKALPDWTVIYFDNAAADGVRGSWIPGQDRSAFEYEIRS